MTEKEFTSLQDLKQYAREINHEQLAVTIELFEDEIEEVEGGYQVSRPTDELPLPSGQDVAFEYGVIVGTFLEQEYPSPTEEDND